MQTDDVRPNAIAEVMSRLPSEAPPAVRSLLEPLREEVALLHSMEDRQLTEAQVARIDAQRSRVRSMVAQAEPEIARAFSSWRPTDNAVPMPAEKLAEEVRAALRMALFIRRPHARVG